MLRVCIKLPIKWGRKGRGWEGIETGRLKGSEGGRGRRKRKGENEWNKNRDGAKLKWGKAWFSFTFPSPFLFILIFSLLFPSLSSFHLFFAFSSSVPFLLHFRFSSLPFFAFLLFPFFFTSLLFLSFPFFPTLSSLSV